MQLVVEPLEPFAQGLRCQDVHSGLRNVDPNSPLLAPLADTRVVGMAATLAGLVRGRDVVDDAQALKAVAAAQLDVDQLAFNEVISVLADAGFVEGVRRDGSKITSFTESVPYYEDLYAALGESWQQRRPTELEQQLIVVVDGLSVAPVPLEELEADFALDKVGHEAAPRGRAGSRARTGTANHRRRPRVLALLRLREPRVAGRLSPRTWLWAADRRIRSVAQ